MPIYIEKKKIGDAFEIYIDVIDENDPNDDANRRKIAIDALK